MLAERDNNGVVRVVTSSKRELFNLSAILARGIEPALLQDKNSPLLVYVEGSYESGKKIFPDAFRRTLMSSASLQAFRGKLDYDELWYYHQGSGQRGRIVEIDFINAAWPVSWYSKLCGSQDDVSPVKRGQTAQKMLSLRRFGGMTFVHNNADDYIRGKVAPKRLTVEEKEMVRAFKEDASFALAGLDIRVVWGGDANLSRGPELFKDQLIQSCSNGHYARYVRIEAGDPRLAASNLFQQALQEICAGGYKNDASYDMDADLTAQKNEAGKTGVTPHAR